MLSEKDLVDLGFSWRQAEKLFKDAFFKRRFKNWHPSVFEQRLQEIEKAYGVSREKVTQAVFKFPQFAGYDHERVVKDIMTVYGVSRGKATQAVFKNRSFAGLDHERVVEGIMRVYGVSREKVTKTVFKFPAFVNYHHERVVEDIMRVYGVSRGKATQAVFKFPQFAGRDHGRVVEDIMRVYGVSREKVVKAVFKFPAFAGLDPVRVLRQVSRIGRFLGLPKQRVIDYLFSKPILASLSWRRNIASIDAVQRAAKRAGVKLSTKQALEWYVNKYGFMKSPYALKGSKARETVLEKQGLLKEPSKMGKAAEKMLKKQRQHRRPR